MTRKTYRVRWRWLDGASRYGAKGESVSVPFTRKRDAQAALRRFQNVALIDFASCRIEESTWPIGGATP